MGTQQDNLNRVDLAIGHVVVEFSNAVGLTSFRGADLLNFVRENTTRIAPDSPGRILRMLRQQKRLNYRVISRSDSLYEFTPLAS